MFAKIFTLIGLASVASAHMKISSPVPYGNSNLDNSPLFDDGSNFPCKLRTGVYDAQGASNVYAQGSTQKLAFIGSAVHGGGSCQISVTTDKEPDANSVWKVIKSIEGGCPAKGQEGNMGDNANAEDPYTYDYTIPAELAAGEYTLAWTWFNKIGNREMYMNCAPLTVTGDGGSEDHLDTLPDMFTANIGNDCGTMPNSDLQFPDPGSDVDKFNGATDAFSAATGNGCGAAATGAPATTAPATSVAATPTTTAAPVTTAAPGDGNSASKSVPGGVFITVSEEPATTAAPVVSTPVASEAPAATSTVPDSGSGSGSGDSFTAGEACSTEGEWNCISGTSFQRCASGAWTASQALSDGVSCTPGQSTDIALSAKRGVMKMRRSLRIRG